MKITILIILGVCMGWFIHSALVVADERIYDWKDDARFAIWSLILIVIITIYF